MNTNSNTNNKKIYLSPEIIQIVLDNEISLVLASDPTPSGEPNWGSQNLNGGQTDPFKNFQA